MTERRNFDIPVHLLSGTDAEHWRPRKAHDPEEIARRALLRSRTIRYQQQAQGMDVAQSVYTFPYSDEESRRFTHEWMATPLYVAAWYMYANENSTPDIRGRRTISLARLASDIGKKKRATREELDSIAKSKLTAANTQAHAFAVNFMHGGETLQQKRNLGRALGNASMMLTALHLDADEDVPAKMIQDVVFLEATNLQAAAMASHERFGVPASIAQLSDPLSPLSVAWKTEAPYEAKHALIEAQSVFGIPE